MNEAKIMILEDEAIVADDILHCLEQTGYLVPAICSSGEQLISRLEKETADLVLVDVMLAGKMDGIDTARIIRERFKIPVVYLTSFTNQTMLERARETFPSGYIVKPFKKRELLATVEMALYPSRSIQKSISNVHSGIGLMIARCWLFFLRQNLDHPEVPKIENEKSKDDDFQKAKSEKLVLLLGKIIGSSQTEFPELSDVLNLVRELITILHPKFNLEAKTSTSDSIPVMDSILLVDALLFILDRFQVDHRLQEINL
ncbi:MAG: response regulator, partial [Deltaproteobacteria bacterium]